MSSRSRFLVGCMIALSGCADEARDAPLETARDVVLVTFDTTRFDRTAAGGRPDLTPRLAELIADGVSFRRAYAPVPVTLPSHATLLSGRSPVVHGLRMNGTARLSPGVPLIAEAFEAAGFATGAFVSSMVLDARFGLERGFQAYDAPPAGALERAGDETAERAIRWLDGIAPSKRVFLWLHLYDPHAPYEPPREFAGYPPYEGEIAAADAALGSVLDALERVGRLDDALIVATADHGEGLGDHGEDEHGIFLYEEAIRVPLVVRLPRARRAGTVVDAIVRLADVAPTALAGAGLPPFAASEGRDLFDAAGAHEGTSAFAETWLPLEMHGFAPLFAVVEGDAKYIEAPSAELYDLAADPREMQNRVARDPAAASRLHAALDRERDALAAHALPGEDVELAAVDRELFEQLGYLTGGGAGADVRIDPKQGILLHQKVREAGREMAAGRSQQALALLDEVRERNPQNRVAALWHARCLATLGRTDEAVASMQEFLAQHADFFEGWLELGKLQWTLDPPAAEGALERAVAVEDGNFEAWSNLGRLRENFLGDPAGALAAYERAAEIDGSGRAWNAVAWLLARAAPPVRDAERALDIALQVVAKEPQDPEFWDTLAEARSACGDRDGAVEAMREALRRAESAGVASEARTRFEERLRAFEAAPPGG